MKKWIMGIIMAVVVFFVSVYMGYYAYSMQHTEPPKMEETRLAEEKQEKHTVVNELVTVASITKKIQPDAVIIIKEYYTKCDHLLQEEEIVEEILVNMTEDELQAYYKDYTIETFSEKEVILYKECKEWCPKHYILKNDNGVVVIYRLNPQGKETVVEKTDIIAEYLPLEDQERLNEGIALVGDELLNSTLEDFE